MPLWISNLKAPTRALSPKGLVVNDSGKSVPVQFLLTPQSDVFFLIGIDLTNDIGTAAVAKEALKQQLLQLPKQAYTAFFGCEDNLRVLQEPTTDRKSALKLVDSLAVKGRAGLFNCMPQIEAIADSMSEASAVRVVALFLTDSAVENYREDFVNPVINTSDPNDISRRFPEQLVQDFASKIAAGMEPRQTPIYIVHLNYENDRLNQAYQSSLKAIARNTLGDAVFCRTLDEIPAALNDGVQHLLNSYSLKVNLPANATKAEIHIEPARGFDYSLTYREHFVFH